jgi:hypothetical protein
MIAVRSKYLKNYSGMCLWPFLLVAHNNRLKDKVFMNHEHIHAAQQKELLLLFFYLWYVADYLIQLLKYNDHSRAYRNIVFEKEAYAMECDLEYLKRRKLFSFLKFYKNNKR